jgi:nucleotide-binding universal stress UspA family protein
MAFHKILCPLDFSPGAQRAMRVAIRLANEHDGELVLVHSWFVPTIYAGELLLSGEAVQQIGDDAERALAGALAEAVALGVRRATSKLLSGVPWQQIVDTALRDSCDLIVIGTHGRTGLARVVLGSVAELVVRHAPCPVLVIRPDGGPAAFRHVLCPVDFSDSSRDAVNLAAGLVQPGGAGITLLHVIELPVSYVGALQPIELARDLEERSAARLDVWVKELKAKVAVPVTQRSRIGGAGSQTLAAIDDDPTVDLVVLGSHGRTGAARLLLGSVAEKVARHARCPVLVARRAR